jgi:hypothetical protein
VGWAGNVAAFVQVNVFFMVVLAPGRLFPSETNPIKLAPIFKKFVELDCPPQLGA